MFLTTGASLAHVTGVPCRGFYQVFIVCDYILDYKSDLVGWGLLPP